MRRLILMLCMIFVVAWSASVLAAGVGVVDMKQVFQTSPQIKKINADLKSKFSGQRSSIMKMGKTLQANLKKYQKNKAVMSSKSLAALKAKITSQEMKLRQAQTKFQRSLFAEQNKRMKTFMDQVKGVVQKIAKKKSLDVVLPKNSVLYSNGSLDLTASVLTGLKK